MSGAKETFKAPYWRTEISLVKQCIFNTRAPILYLCTYYTHRINQVPVCHLIMSDVLCVVHTSTIVLCGGEIVESLGVLTVTQNPTSWQSCPIPGRGRGCGMCFIFFRWEPSDWDGEHIGTTSMKYNCSCSDDCFGQKVMESKRWWWYWIHNVISEIWFLGLDLILIWCISYLKLDSLQEEKIEIGENGAAEDFLW